MMNTIVLDEPFKFRNTQTEEPGDPGPGEALVQVRRLGICGTDYHAFRGRQPFFNYPRILGHELGVEILALGSTNDAINVGDQCAVEPYLNCGSCIACRAGKTNCCSSLKVLGVHIDGGMRERILVPIHKLHQSTTLGLDRLALVETLGIGAHAVDRAAIKSSENVLVLGAGPIGLTVIQFATAAGARVIVMDINEKRLAFCKANMNVCAALVWDEHAVNRLEQACDGDLPTAVFDATGNPESMNGAFKIVASGGRLVFVGLFLGDVTFYDPDFHRKELTLLATRNSTGNDFRRIIGLMEAGVVDPIPWITHRAKFIDLADIFSSWLDPAEGVIKAVVACDD
jgi:2-desacetyl-2-hydroxyethyl bacteriochlorophyllide A dehydrogenase